MTRDPESLSEWIGYFLFHDRVTLSIVGVGALIVFGYWIRGLVDRARRWKRTHGRAQTGTGGGS
jgi:hypothetical protein